MPNDVSPLTESSPAWIRLVTRVDTVEHKIDNATQVSRRTEKAVLGGYDDSGTVWRKGIREQVESIDAKVDSVKDDVKAVKVDVAGANAKADAFKALGWWAIGGVWALVLGVALEFVNSYFGFWGAAHAANKIITGGH